MDARTRELVQATNDVRALVADAQTILTDYLIPDGLNSDQALNRLLELFDGPRQRQTEARVQAAIKATETP